MTVIPTINRWIESCQQTIRDYGEINIRHETAQQITAIDNTTYHHTLEVILSKESGEQWRVTLKRLLDDNETTQVEIS